MERQIDMVFFDIGGTLGDRNAAGKFVAFPSSAGLLQSMRQIGLRIGIITTLGTQLTNAQALEMLKQAGLDQFLDPNGFVSDHDAGAAKPNPEIYRFAASKAGVEIGRCLFAGENFVEVIGAMVAGMRVMLKPCPPGRELPS